MFSNQANCTGFQNNQNGIMMKLRYTVLFLKSFR